LVRGVLITLVLSAMATAEPPPAPPPPAPPPPTYPQIHYRHCRALGKPWAGRLVRGTKLPAEGKDFFTWDPVRKRKPNRSSRRYGCDFAIRKVLRVLASYRLAFPWAPRVGIGDVSRARGGEFGERFGGLGHGSHQMGVDFDLYYPRWDGLERAPRKVDQIDYDLAQALLDRFVRAGVKYAFVGPHTELAGPPKIVQPLVYHDDHMHLRFRVPRSRR
jgi:murein endopeptidase